MEQILYETNILSANDDESVFHIIFSDCNGIRNYIDAENAVLKYDDKKQLGFGMWKETQKFSSKRRWFEARSGIDDAFFDIESFLETLEDGLGNDDGVLFVAEIKPAKVDTPESMLAKVWNECLGPRAIPFDPVARAALIAEGCKHSELKRHIEAWQEMKRTGSKWATGEWMNEK
jgi:hypothetical protein